MQLVEEKLSTIALENKVAPYSDMLEICTDLAIPFTGIFSRLRLFHILYPHCLLRNWIHCALEYYTTIKITAAQFNPNNIILSGIKQVRRTHSFILLVLIYSSRRDKIRKYILYGIIHIQINCKRKQGNYKHKIQDCSYPKKERKVVKEDVMD